MSRFNRIEPRKLFEILKLGYEMPEFVTSMAKPGEANSTFIKRTALPNNVKVKDGALAGVRCLCGYAAGSRPKAFVIIANSFTPPFQDVLVVIDKFIKDKL
jgi:D-alanyl-D-alanine carboxypeptidase